MPVPAILGTARLGNFRLGYVPAATEAIRETRVRITVAGQLVRYRRGSVTIRDVINDSPNTCDLIINSDTPPTQSQPIRITINSSTPRLLFNGALETIGESYILKPDQLEYHCTAQDDTPRANRRIPLAHYEDTPADDVAIDLVERFAPGFTANHVQPGLPNVTIHYEGSEAGMNGCLRALCKMIGAYFKWEDRDLWLFTDITELTSDLPDDIDSTPGRLLDNPHIAITYDDSQLRTRVYGKGHQEQTTAEVAVGANTIPIGDATFYNPLGGQVISESQILDYAGTSVGGSGALVGTTVTPTNAPTFAPITAASGVDAGDHQLAYTFYDGTGETLPSPLSAIFTSGSVVTAPSSTPVATRQRGGNLSVGNYDWVTAFVDSVGGITTVSPASAVVAMVATPTAPASIGTAGQTDAPGVAALDDSANYGYGQTFVDDATGLESELSPLATFTTTLGIYHGFLLESGTSNPPAGHSRRFYRTEGNGSVYKRLPGPANGFEVNSGGLWYEGYADSALGAAAPTAANYKQADVTIPVSLDSNVVSVNIYRPVANGSTRKLAGTVGNGTTLWRDNVADGSLGATAPTSSTAVYRQALVTVANGPAGTTGKKLYMTPVGSAQLKLAYTIANNTTITQLVSIADASLGANVPTSDTSGLVTQTGSVAAGSTSMLVTSTGDFVSGGGWAFIGNLPVRYGGFSGSSLTGIPASGVGALTTSVRYGAEVIAAAMLTGVTGIIRTLIKGAPIHIWVQEDDLDAQAALAAREGEGDGIIEHRIVDERRGEESLRALCRADLTQFAYPIVTVTGASRDVKKKSGKPQVFDLPSPFIDETLTLQDVTITEIDIADRLPPRFTFTASNARFSLEDLLRRMANASLEGQ